MEEQNKTNQNLEQETQVEQEYNPVPHEEITENKKNRKWLIIIISLALIGVAVYGFLQIIEDKNNIVYEVPKDELYKPLSEKTEDAVNKKEKGITITNAGKEYIINSEDVDILEHYSGVTWSETDDKVYFLKYIEVDLTKEMYKKLDDEHSTMLVKRLEELIGFTEEEMENMTTEEIEEHRNNISDESWEELFNNLPDKYNDNSELFQEVQIFEYDISEDKISFLASMDYDPGGYPVRFFFSAYTIDNKFNFGASGLIYTLDIDSKKITNRPGPLPSGSNNIVNIDAEDGGVFGPNRYISFDEHGYFEMPYISAFDNGYDVRLRYFYDDNTRLKNSNKYNMSSDSRVFAGSLDPQGFLDNTLLRSPAEIEFREELSNN